MSYLQSNSQEMAKVLIAENAKHELEINVHEEANKSITEGPKF